MTLANVINKALYGGSPYDGFDIERYPMDLSGWFTEPETFDEIIARIRPALIIEVGSWKGLSSHYLIKRALEYADASIICVDTWLGSSEHWINPAWREGLGMKFGRPTLHEQFIANVIHAGLTDRVVPLPLPARLASAVLQRMRKGASAFAPLVYIDGAHDEASVREDLAAYWPLVSAGGILVGDDYSPSSWPGVIRAFDWLCETYAHEIHAAGPVGGRFFVQKSVDVTEQNYPSVMGLHFGEGLEHILEGGFMVPE